MTVGNSLRFRLFQRPAPISRAVACSYGHRHARQVRNGDVDRTLAFQVNMEDNAMPIILWLLGVPLSIIIVLALLGVF